MVPREATELGLLQDRLEEGPGHDGYAMRSRLSGRSAVGDRFANDVRQVLDQRSPQRHVQHLGPATDAQGRYALLYNAPREVEFAGVALVVDHVDGLVVAATVPGWVDVPATRENEPVEAFEHWVGTVVTGR